MISKKWLGLVLSLLLAQTAAVAKEGEVEALWQRTKKAGKRLGKGVGQGGKEVGRSFQEVFDPNDEDLKAERKGKKKDGDKEKK